MARARVPAGLAGDLHEVFGGVCTLDVRVARLVEYLAHGARPLPHVEDLRIARHVQQTVVAWLGRLRDVSTRGWHAHCLNQLQWVFSPNLEHHLIVAGGIEQVIVLANAFRRDPLAELFNNGIRADDLLRHLLLSF